MIEKMERSFTQVNHKIEPLINELKLIHRILPQESGIKFKNFKGDGNKAIKGHLATVYFATPIKDNVVATGSADQIIKIW